MTDNTITPDAKATTNSPVETLSGAKKPLPRPVKPKPVISPAQKPKIDREASTIAFPYGDLETAVSVAAAILGSGGVALTRDQLAGVMNSTAGSGTFISKVATARVFGLISSAQGKFELTNLGFSILDRDEVRQRKARVEAFLTVPLYQRAYDEFKGRQLPPRPHGLEKAFINFGVSSKQGQNARLAFDKSAKQAGFFSNGPDRLIEPIIGGLSAAERSRSPVDQNDDEIVEARRVALIPPNNATSRHPFVQGLLDTLPEPNTNWTIEGRAKWLQAAANIFDLIYKGSGEIRIVAHESKKLDGDP